MIYSHLNLTKLALLKTNKALRGRADECGVRQLGNEMHQYITETEYATKHLLDLALREEDELGKLLDKIAPLEARHSVHKWDYQTSEWHDDFSDAYVMGAFHRMAKAAAEKEEVEAKIARLQALIGTRQSSIQAICGAVLQIAKQGISIVHGGLNGPAGRTVGATTLRDIIWQARNQAIHSEEGDFRPPIVQTFSELEANFGNQLSLTQHPKQSRAKQVLKLLEWDSYDNYERDMTSLL